MSKTISRTFTTNQVLIKDSVSGAILKTESTTGKVEKSKVAMKYLKETGNTGFYVEITAVEELREMPVETFIAHSTVVTPSTTADTSEVK